MKIWRIITLAVICAAASIPSYSEDMSSDVINSEEWNSKALSLWQVNTYSDPQKAIEYFNKAVEINPEYSTAFFNRGRAWLQKGDYERAMYDLNHANEINSFLNYKQSNVRMIMQDKNHGFRDEKSGDDNKQVKEWINNAEYDRAIDYYNHIIEINPSNASAYNNRATAWAKKGNYERAVKDYNKAIEINPVNASAYNNRGYLWADRGYNDLAIEDYSCAIRINPEFEEAYNNRGAAYSDKGDYGRAIKDYTQAISINPRFEEAYSNRGNVYLDIKEKENACMDFKKACELGNCSEMINCVP